ncbi:MAG: GH3 auxin-responsive promoter family protein, partial [Candidatus Obscuribacterales bacterium]|nr:GH3 auxin-responsive promoter family protein [Candidatus Obscuribacterales bacterium]
LNQELKNLLNSFENELGKNNIEYKAKRDSMRLDPPQLSIIKRGAYEALRKEMTAAGVADAQIKLSHLNPKAEVRRYFEQNLEEEHLHSSVVS